MVAESASHFKENRGENIIREIDGCDVLIGFTIGCGVNGVFA